MKMRSASSILMVGRQWLAARTSAQIAFLVAGLSLVLQWIVWWNYRQTPFYSSPVCDASVYADWARAILSGNWLGTAVFYQPPLYPYFVALIWACAGVHYGAVFGVQIVLNAMTAALMVLAAARFAGKTAGWLAGLGFVFYGAFSFYALKLLSETLPVFLHVLLFYCLVRTPAALPWRLSAGAVAGLLALGKPHTLLLWPFIGLWLIAGAPPEDATNGAALRSLPSKAVRCRHVFAFFLPALTLVLLITWRNYAVGGDGVLISSNGGENFYIGNNPAADGGYKPVEVSVWSPKDQQRDVRRVAEAAMGRTLKPSEVSAWWLRRGLDFIARQPRLFLRLEQTKLIKTFSGKEYANMYYLRFERAKFARALWLMPIDMYWVFPLAIVGACALARSWRRYILLYAMIAANLLTLLVFFVDERYRLAMIPFLILMGGAGAVEAWRTWRAPRASPARRAVLVAATAAAVLVTATIWLGDRATRHDVDHILYLMVGDIYFDKKEYKQALKAYYESSRLAVNNWESAIGVSKALYALGHQEVAVKLYREAWPHLPPELQREYAADAALAGLRARAANTHSRMPAEGSPVPIRSGSGP